jgi:hypothetical protein
MAPAKPKKMVTSPANIRPHISAPRARFRAWKEVSAILATSSEAEHEGDMENGVTGG